MYLIDSDVLIESHRRYYSMDFCPGFWDWIIQEHQNGVLFSVDAVRRGLIQQNDSLSRWAKQLPKTFFLATTGRSTPYLRSLAKWCVCSGYAQHEVDRFLGCADYHLVGQAMELGYSVVTHESSGTLGSGGIKIPDACNQFQVKVTRPYQLLRICNARFVLA